MNTLKLGTIEEEAAACRARWAGHGIGTLAAHLHHGIPFELLKEPAERRIAFILSEKAEDEHALRLRCFAPVNLAKFLKLQKAEAALRKGETELRNAIGARKAEAAWRKIKTALRKISVETPHAKLCPLGEHCPWDGKTIFPKSK
jgi:hypothetical protein